jgi:hypothetical protein
MRWPDLPQVNKSSRVILSFLSGPVDIRTIFLDKIDSIA